MSQEKSAWAKRRVAGSREELLCQEKSDWVKRRVTESRGVWLGQKKCLWTPWPSGYGH